MAIIHQSATRRIQVYLNGQPQTFTAGSNGGFTMTGTVISYTTGIIPVAGQQLSVGQLFTSPLVFNGSLTNLRITTGPGAMYLYNNNAFTPSTSPLFPASNTAGGSLTTRLLVRVPLAPGKMVVPKLGGANCNTVLAFPPAPMTTYATNMTGQSYYGGGVYVASASSELSSSYQAWQAFDKVGTTVGSIWASYAAYGSTSPYGTLGSNVTVDVTGTSYAGEWLQLQMPSSIILANYSLTGGSQAATQSPARFWILGSRDGTSWSLVDSRTGVGSWVNYVAQNFSVSSGQAFTYFRIVVNQLAGYFSANPQCVIAEWTLNGSIESVNVTADGRLGVGVTAPTQALEVAGSAVVAGTLSAGNPLMFRNALYNGDFRIAQRGTSFAGLGSYGLDRWFVSAYGAGANYTVSQIQSGLANFSNALQLQQTSTSLTNAWISQSLETRDVVRFQGQPVTVSFWYRIPTSFTGPWIAQLAWSTAVDTNLPNSGVSSTATSLLVLPNTTAWTYASFQAFVPPTATALAVQFVTTNGVINGAQFQLTGVQLEKGSVATPFEVRPYGVELQLCQRYYEQSWEIGTAPGTNTTTGIFSTSGTTDGTPRAYTTVRYAVPKRAAVTPTFYTNVGVAGSWNYYQNGVTSTSSVTLYNTAAITTGFSVYIAATTGWAPVTILGHWVANAEL
jgi:hypothetical protein